MGDPDHSSRYTETLFCDCLGSDRVLTNDIMKKLRTLYTKLPTFQNIFCTASHHRSYKIGAPTCSFRRLSRGSWASPDRPPVTRPWVAMTSPLTAENIPKARSPAPTAVSASSPPASPSPSQTSDSRWPLCRAVSEPCCSLYPERSSRCLPPGTAVCHPEQVETTNLCGWVGRCY